MMEQESILRLKLSQNVANYRKPESAENKMTYPLPPFSTIIGAIHSACGYTEYHQMDISVQGDFQTLKDRVYTNHCFLNSTQDDRGILVKLVDGKFLSRGYIEVAKPLKSQGSSFAKRQFIQVLDETLFEEYISLKKLEVEFKENTKPTIKKEIKDLKMKEKEIKVEIKKNSTEELGIQLKILQEEIGIKVEDMKIYEKMQIVQPLSKYKSLTTSLQRYELLYGIQLIIHIKSDSKTISEIEENIYNLKSLGRSEDFVNIEEVKRVQLLEEFDEVRCSNSMFISHEAIKNEEVELRVSTGIRKGTTYYINKDYEIKDGKRIFNKKKVVYASEFEVYQEDNQFAFVDEDGNIICFN